jgi:hypothetical protein
MRTKAPFSIFKRPSMGSMKKALFGLDVVA